jgi:hypothetical protein
MDNTLHEIMFQGITFINRLRKSFFLDILDKKVNTLDVKYFRYTLIAYSNEWEKRHKNVINTEHPDGFNLIKFIDSLRTKQKSYHKQKLIVKEVVLKLLITIIFNSKQIYSDETFKKLYQAFMPDYKELYKQKKIKEKANKINDDDNISNEEEENEEEDKKEGEEEEKPKKKKNKNKNKDENIEIKQTSSKTKTSLDKLLKIVDVGLDKPIEDFDKEINIMQNIYENNNGLNIPYELYGAVTCINYNEPTEEHFISFCKNNNKWYKYHDIEVSKPINDIQKDILEYKTPIILFYKKF